MLKKLVLVSAVSFTLLSFYKIGNPILEMVKVEGGTFMMGSKDDSRIAENDEQKQHEVKLNSFEINKLEVTVWEWKDYCKKTKKKMPKAPTWGWNENNPVTNITWFDAVEYCNWLSKIEGLKQAYIVVGPNVKCDFTTNGYRLPTEAEWEFAAKGGKKSKGNVWEWCWDWYNKDYYKIEDGNNPKGPIRGEKKVVRGGSWDSQENYLRTANRISTDPNKTNEFYGFRLARTLN